MSMLSLNTPQPSPRQPAGTPAAIAPRPQYIELKANVHRKLLNRLNLEALATADRSRAEGEIRSLLYELIAEESMPLSMAERDAILGEARSAAHRLPGRQAPDARHRPHRVGSRSPSGRQLADGGRAPAGRLARQRDHPAAGR
jgi:hypothetical protein